MTLSVRSKFFVFVYFFICSACVSCTGILHEKVCFSPGCLTTAGFFINNINQAVHPCENFYEHVCGNFGENAMVNFYNPNITTMSQRYEEFLSEIRLVLHSPKDTSDSESLLKAKDFYHTCMNTSFEEELSAMNLFIRDKLGSLPLANGDDWQSHNFSIIEKSVDLSSFGLLDVGLINIYPRFEEKLGIYELTIDVSSPGFITLFGDTKNLSLSELKLLAIPILTQITEFLEVNNENFTEQWHEVINFMYAFVQLKREAIDDEVRTTPEKITLEQLKAIIPEIKWDQLFEKFCFPSTSNELVLHTQSIHKLRELINLTESTDNRILANFLIYNFVVTLYKEKHFAYSVLKKIKSLIDPKDSLNYQPTLNRLIHCIEFVRKTGDIIKVKHFRIYNSPDNMVQVKDIEAQIRHETLNYFKDSKHIKYEEATIIEKLLYVKSFNSVPLEFLDDEYLDKQYAGLTSQTDNHFANVLAIEKFTTCKKMKQEENHNITKMNCHNICYYGNAEKGIFYHEIPQHFLRGIVYSNDRSRSMNFGFLGFKIAQVLLSYLEQNTKETFQLFPIRTKNNERFFQQLKKENGRITNSTKLSEKESLALNSILMDKIALNITFEAYNSWLLQNGEDFTLPTLNYSLHQLFWMGYTGANCQAYDEDFVYNLDDGNYPQKITVSSVLHNLREFNEEFHCSFDLP